MERWVPVPGYEGRYEVSNLGRVRSLMYVTKAWERPRAEPFVLRATPGNNGYPAVHLSFGKVCKRHSVHRLVMIAFAGPEPDGMEVAHKDGVRTHCALSNLEWKTRKDNHADKLIHGTSQRGERCGKAKLTWAQVQEIRRRYRRRSMVCGGAALAREFGVSEFAIQSVVHHRTWIDDGQPLERAA